MASRLYKLCSIFNPVFTAANIEEDFERKLENIKLVGLLGSSFDIVEVQAQAQEVLFESDEELQPIEGATAAKAKGGSCRDNTVHSQVHFPPHLDRNFLNFPFLTDPKTIRHIRRGGVKVMLIMRGLSGSGKSSIVEAIKLVYSDQAVVCSADHFFHQPDGSYAFNEKLLSAAHGTCQHKAKEACQAGFPVVVIDNTNVRRWEMKSYLSQANISNYVVVLVEPQTPWKWDAQELAARNKHGVPVDLLRKKVASFDEAIPSYFAWFLNEKKSLGLSHLCSRLFKECLSAMPGLKADMLKELGIKRDVDEETADGILARYFSTQARSSDILHCTTMFCARGKVPGSSQYAKRSDVQSAYGRIFTLSITGVIITKKTLSVRVTLDQEMSALFSRPEERNWAASKSTMLHSPRASRSPNQRRFQAEPDVDISSLKGRQAKKAQRALKRGKKDERRRIRNGARNSDEEEVDTENVLDAAQGMGESFDGCYSDRNSSLEESFDRKVCLTDDLDGDDSASAQARSLSRGPLSQFFPALRYSGFARSAHMTIKTAWRVEAKETNFDVLTVCDVESNHRYRETDFVPLERGKGYYYGDGVCCVYFDNPIKLNSVFSGFY